MVFNPHRVNPIILMGTKDANANNQSRPVEQVEQEEQGELEELAAKEVKEEQVARVEKEVKPLAQSSPK